MSVTICGDVDMVYRHHCGTVKRDLHKCQSDKKGVWLTFDLGTVGDDGIRGCGTSHEVLMCKISSSE